MLDHLTAAQYLLDIIQSGIPGPKTLGYALRARIVKSIIDALETDECRIGLFDGRYLALPGATTFVDVFQPDQSLTELPALPVTSIWLDGKETVRRLQRANARESDR